VALSFHYRELRNQATPPSRIALLPGAWNPPTVAHLAIARAALVWADEVVLVLPVKMPHKEFDGPTFHDRIATLSLLAAAHRQLSAATAEGGLYVEMAEEAHSALGPQTEIALVCGRDAAERIASWNYGQPGVFEQMIARFPLLVAARSGEYAVDPSHEGRIRTLALADDFSAVSSSEIRRRMEAGEDWQSLVPPEIADRVRRLYAPSKPLK
jgi:nicotinate (nicotinamide) nucleotide adenylyltransferase